ncbi:hypothetical protein [Fodinicurvata sp. EGI_FJ10296]|uniref:hypothetical protein n=1 Tax=Fodinicurvata sp. EGI_FJ10296 TaxID=3231908 RepID=UPI0034534FA8
MGFVPTAIKEEATRPLAVVPSTDDAVAILGRYRQSAQNFEAALDQYRKQVISVDHRLKLAIMSIREMLETAGQANDRDVLVYLTHDAIPGVIDGLDRRILAAKALADRYSGYKGDVSSPPQRQIAEAAKRIRKEVRKNGKMLARHRGRLTDLVWDFDPESRGGESFYYSDDLIALLASNTTNFVLGINP